MPLPAVVVRAVLERPHVDRARRSEWRGPVRIIEDDARLFWLAPPAHSFFAYFAGRALWFWNVIRDGLEQMNQKNDEQADLDGNDQADC